MTWINKYYRHSVFTITSHGYSGFYWGRLFISLSRFEFFLYWIYTIKR